MFGDCKDYAVVYQPLNHSRQREIIARPALMQGVRRIRVKSNPIEFYARTIAEVRDGSGGNSTALRVQGGGGDQGVGKGRWWRELTHATATEEADASNR